MIVAPTNFAPPRGPFITPQAMEAHGAAAKAAAKGTARAVLHPPSETAEVCSVDVMFTHDEWMVRAAQ